MPTNVGNTAYFTPWMFLRYSIVRCDAAGQYRFRGNSYILDLVVNHMMANSIFNNEGTDHARCQNRSQINRDPPIWVARNVEWPIPSQLSFQQFKSLIKASRTLGQQLGINTAPEEDSSTNQAEASSDTGAADSNYFSGFMNRVLNTGATGGNEGNNNSAVNPHSSSSLSLKNPRPGCVAAANGWIVAALECTAHSDHHPALRLISRWNVRRGGVAPPWIVLPPPVCGNGKVNFVFCDPSASHMLVSCANGEAYYWHASQKGVDKLAGFGRNSDGNLPASLTGISATSTVHRRDETGKGTVQAGLSDGSHITAVAWDREQGTEGSTKRILLGTNLGEIYEYAMAAPNSQEESLPLPVLIHKLPESSAVTGLFFERLRTGLVVLCASSARSRKTQLFSFYSAHNSSFRMTLGDQRHSSCIDLPGSIDFADFRMSADHFAMKTAVGIYYGTLDRTGSAVLEHKRTLIKESGILPYEEGQNGSPVSLALTPHHFITLSETQEVQFINRVSQKVIQREHVEMHRGLKNRSGLIDETQMGVGEFLLDVRRPDQVWLRKGRSLVHISSSQEDRDVWKFTLKKCLTNPLYAPLASTDVNGGNLSSEEKSQEAFFDQARTLCSSQAQKAIVTAMRGEYNLLHGRYDLAAKNLASCPPQLKPFADTAIRLSMINDAADKDSSPRSLISYLSDKLRTTRLQEDRMASTMLGAWLTELTLSHAPETLVQFLSSNLENMDAKTVLTVLSSHDVEASECGTFANRSGDLGTAVNAALSIGGRDSVCIWELRLMPSGFSHAGLFMIFNRVGLSSLFKF